MVTTCRWFSAARLVVAFARSGCIVDALCPFGHPAIGIRALNRWHLHNLLNPLPSLRATIRATEPDFVFPCDDLAAVQLHRLYAMGEKYSSPSTLQLLRRSLGDPDGFPILESRSRFLDLVREEGICTPATSTVCSAAEVEHWCEQHEFPAVLKADGTSGGEGVIIAGTLAEARRAYRKLNAPLGSIAVAKRATLDGDLNLLLPWALRRKRIVSIQEFVRGHDTNMAVACWEGKILATISVEVVRTFKAKGPATIVRRIDDDQMYLAAEKIVKRFQLSGFCGLDFMVDERTRIASLIEINARATQTCHLPLGKDHDPVASIASAISGEAMGEFKSVTHCDTIALFPLAWQADPSSEFLRTAYHDVPWEEPKLVRAGVARQSALTYDNCLELWSKVSLRHRATPVEETHEV